MYFEHIEEFNDFVHKAQSDHDYYFEVVNIKEKETQDLLHELEFADYDASRKVTSKLRKVRQERREAKDIVETLQPVIDYIEKNKTSINYLSNLLGIVKKEEKRHQNRVYKPRVRNDLTIASALNVSNVTEIKKIG